MKKRQKVGIMLLLIMVLQMGVSVYGSTTNSYYGQLGSSTSLGSPILDKNFSSDDWNKWEMVTWGIFLSNFPVPLIDDYESAFNTSSTTGSKGSGFKALNFGTGADATNRDVINNLLRYAINQQTQGKVKEIFVDFSEVKRGKIDKKIHVNTTEEYVEADGEAGDTEDVQEEDESVQVDIGTMRQAQFRDLFIMDSAGESETWLKVQNTNGAYNFSNMYAIESGAANTVVGAADSLYENIAAIEQGSLPTFYVANGTGYEEVFDYTNGWDAQIMTAWISRIITSEYKDEFKTVFGDMWDKSDELKLFLDTFGNIIVSYNGSRRIMIPASINQHLTSTPKINLVSSLIFNGLNAGLQGTELALVGRQSESGFFGTNIFTDITAGGVPALGSHLSGIPNGMISFYYDMDTIMQDTYVNGGELANGTKSPRAESLSPVYSTHYGKAVKTLFDLDANKKEGNKYTFKIEAANMSKIDLSWIGKDKAQTALKTMLITNGQIANISGTTVNAEVLTEINIGSGKQSLFSNPIIVPVQMDSGRTNNKINSAGVARLYLNYLYNAYESGSNSVAVDVSKEYVNGMLDTSESSTMKKFHANVLGTDNKKINKLLAGYIAGNESMFKLKVSGRDVEGKSYTGNNPFKSMSAVADPQYAIGDESLERFGGRMIKAYPISEVMKSVGNVLGVREGTEFGLYSTYIYMTYLEWYGVTTGNKFGGETHSFNPRIFDGNEDILKVDINTIAPFKSEEDKRKEILDYTYLLLHPTEGKAYKNALTSGFMTNMIYDNYQKIVYGSANSYYENISPDLSSRNSTGFLNVDSYSDNFMTSWFMDMYAKIAIIVIGLASILIVVVGVIKSRKVSWYLVSLIVVINAVLLVPTTGEITPALANRFVQSMFEDKMTFWGISESVTNANIEKDYVSGAGMNSSYLGSMTQDERAKVVELVKSLNTLYVDRALMVKSDISKKVTQTSYGDFAEIQKLRSARWMLPMIMRQFSSGDNTSDYVYLPLGDMYDDMSNLYWLYKPDDAVASQTVAGQQSGEGGYNGIVARKENEIKEYVRKNYFPDYIIDGTNTSGIEYRSAAYDDKSKNDMVHTYFYLLKDNVGMLTRNAGFAGSYLGKVSYADYAGNSLLSVNRANLLQVAVKLERDAGTYSRFDRSTLQQSFGYLWSTETVYPYMYTSIKDSFQTDMTLGHLVGKLQGSYTAGDNAVRKSFMHAGETGLVRDVLDLEEMFKNMLPYIYQMQLTTGGIDGTTGVLGNEKIEHYELYKNNPKSWMFRSNWVTKIMESPELTKPATVRDSAGNKIRIENPTLVDSYPVGRPMIFSEAQMVSEGLSKSDLSLVELKSIEVNDNVSKEWTKLLNYINLEGMSKEVIYRQMATEAVIVFNKEFSPSGIVSNSFKLLPTGLDLRSISFDSVMKMLVMNSTKDTTYIYGDTMLNIINDSDMFTASLLLIAAFLSTYIIPFMRNIVMGLIFYLGLVAILQTIFGETEKKAKVSGGYIISNILFLLMTVSYFGVFAMLMNITSSDEILTTQSVQVNVGNPVFIFIVIIIVSIAYIVGMYRMINFCFRNYRDMGMEVYMNVASMVTERVGGVVESVSGKIGGASDTAVSTGGRAKSAPVGEYPKEAVDNDLNREEYEDDSAYDSKLYTMSKEGVNDGYRADELNDEIENGKRDL